MTKRPLLKVIIMICFSALHLQACADAHRSDSVKLKHVEKEGEEFIKTLKKYSYDQRDEAVSETKEFISDVDSKIDALQNKVDNQWEKMDQAARNQTRKTLKTLRKQRNEVSEWFGSMKNSSASAWNEIKEGFAGAYKTLSKSWVEAKQEFDDKKS